MARRRSGGAMIKEKNGLKILRVLLLTVFCPLILPIPLTWSSSLGSWGRQASILIE